VNGRGPQPGGGRNPHLLRFPARGGLDWSLGDSPAGAILSGHVRWKPMASHGNSPSSLGRSLRAVHSDIQPNACFSEPDREVRLPRILVWGHPYPARLSVKGGETRPGGAPGAPGLTFPGNVRRDAPLFLEREKGVWHHFPAARGHAKRPEAERGPVKNEKYRQNGKLREKGSISML